MSTRPSRKLKSKCPSKTTDYAIIGDTVSAVMTALKLRREGVCTTIHHITSGSDKTSDSLESTDFIPENSKNILHYMQNTKIHYATSEDCNVECPPPCSTSCNSSSSNCTSCTSQQVQACNQKCGTTTSTCNCSCSCDNLDHYYIDRDVFYTSGSGPIGDVVASPTLPRIGPWFSNSSSASKIQRFVDRYFPASSLSANEKLIACRLSDLWDIPLTDSPNVSGPSIMGRHYTLKKREGNKTLRQLFINEYQTMLAQSNVVSHTEQNCIYFDPSEMTEGNWHISGRNINIPDVKVLFKTNPYNWLTLATKGEMFPSPIKIPVFYRAVIPLLKSGSINIGTKQTNGELSTPNYSGIQLTNTTNNNCGCDSSSQCPTHEDYVHTHNTFSLHNFRSNNRQNTLSWLGHAYSTSEDFFPTDQQGWFSSDLYHLLIVECVSLENRRQASYNNSHQEVHINYNKKSTEEKYLRVFARIVSDVIVAYTGSRITPESLLRENQLCTGSGACFDYQLIHNYSHRETSLTTLLEMITGIFGTDHYVNYEGQNQ